MKNCFTGDWKITQKFGEDFKVDGEWYYRDRLARENNYPLLGHNGIDVIPVDDDWGVYNIFNGQIIYCGWHNDYGNRIGIWERELGIVEWYNHLAQINSSFAVGKLIGERMWLGIMGKTGKSFGEHVHYQICHVDKECKRIDYNNGFFGYIPPMEFIK